jgi:hypothetical protein
MQSSTKAYANENRVGQHLQSTAEGTAARTRLQPSRRTLPGDGRQEAQQRIELRIGGVADARLRAGAPLRRQAASVPTHVLLAMLATFTAQQRVDPGAAIMPWYCIGIHSSRDAGFTSSHCPLANK